MGRQYIWRYKCPVCGKPYAKKTLWVAHIRKHAENKKSPAPQK